MMLGISSVLGGKKIIRASDMQAVILSLIFTVLLNVLELCSFRDSDKTIRNFCSER